MTPAPSKRHRLTRLMREALQSLQDDWRPAPLARERTARALAARGLADVRRDASRQFPALEWRRPRAREAAPDHRDA